MKNLDELLAESTITTNKLGAGLSEGHELMLQVRRVIEGECPYCPGVRLRLVPHKFNPDDFWAACSCCGFQFQGSIPGVGDTECALSLTGWPDGMGGPQNVDRCGHPPRPLR